MLPRWLEEELLRRLEADFIKGQAHAVATTTYEDVALAAAAGGNLGRLRRMYPRIAEYINPPPPEEWPSGKRRTKPKQQDADYLFRVREAYKDAQAIRGLWRERATAVPGGAMGASPSGMPRGCGTSTRTRSRRDGRAGGESHRRRLGRLNTPAP